MSYITPDIITALQQNPKNIRNIVILAHVDHGKTTLTDFLLTSNGLVSSKLAGKLRMMDSRPDEQEREITMKSSSIALAYKLQNRPKWQLPLDLRPEDDPEPLVSKEKRDNLFLINVIDSPGHVDFASEVASAARISDGAFVLIDVLEGFSVQTHAVLYQAWLEGVKPCLVLNKLDRLITEVKLTPYEAYLHCVHIIEHVNAMVSTFQIQDAMLKVYENENENDEKGGDNDDNNDDKNDEKEQQVLEGEVKTEKKEKREKKEKKEKKDDKKSKKDDKKSKKDDKKTKKESKRDSKDLDLDCHPHISPVLLLQKEKERQLEIEKKIAEKNQKNPKKISALHEAAADIDDKSKWEFSPAFGNVAFVSSWDSFGFSIDQFAYKLSIELNISLEEMRHYMWGEYYLYTTHDESGNEVKKITKNPEKCDEKYGKKPLFVTHIFEPIWNVYETALGTFMQDIQFSNSNINIDLATTHINNVQEVWDLIQTPEYNLTDIVLGSDIGLGHKWDWRSQVRGVFTKWLPIADCLLTMSIYHLPSPIQAQQVKLTRIMPDLIKNGAILLDNIENNDQNNDQNVSKNRLIPTKPATLSKREELLSQFSKDTLSCSSTSPFLFVYISKIVPISSLSVIQPRIQRTQRILPAGRSGAAVNPRAATALAAAMNQEQMQQPKESLFGENNKFMAIARVFCGTLTPYTAHCESDNNGGVNTDPHLMAYSTLYNPNMQLAEQQNSANTILVPEEAQNFLKKKHTDQNHEGNHPFKIFSLMGRDCQPLNSVCAGNIVGITGIDHILYKFYTLSNFDLILSKLVSNNPTGLSTHSLFQTTTPYYLPLLKPLSIQTKPIFEVVIEPARLDNSNLLYSALQTLDLIDANITVGLNDRGEYYIAASGELHLERCIKDLKDMLTDIPTSTHFDENNEQITTKITVDLLVHPPTVHYRETVVSPYSLTVNNPRQIPNLIHLFKNSKFSRLKSLALLRQYRNLLIQHDQQNYLETLRELDQLEAKMMQRNHSDAPEITNHSQPGPNSSQNQNPDDGNGNDENEATVGDDHDFQKVETKVLTDVTILKHGSWVRKNVIRTTTPAHHVQFRLRVVPLPTAVATFLDENKTTIKTFFSKISYFKLLLKSYLENFVNIFSGQFYGQYSEKMYQFYQSDTFSPLMSLVSTLGNTNEFLLSVYNDHFFKKIENSIENNISYRLLQKVLDLGILLMLFNAMFQQQTIESLITLIDELQLQYESKHGKNDQNDQQTSSLFSLFLMKFHDQKATISSYILNHEELRLLSDLKALFAQEVIGKKVSGQKNEINLGNDENDEKNKNEKSNPVQQLPNNNLSLLNDVSWFQLGVLNLTQNADTQTGLPCEQNDNQNTPNNQFSPNTPLTHNQTSLYDLYSTGAIVDYIMAFGNRYCGPNLLINTVPFFSLFSSLSSLTQQATSFTPVFSSLYNSIAMNLNPRMITPSNYHNTMVDNEGGDVEGNFQQKQVEQSKSFGSIFSISTKSEAQFHKKQRFYMTFYNLITTFKYACYYLKHIEPALILGFQQVTKNGPLCHEPMMGVGFVIDKFTIFNNKLDEFLQLDNLLPGFNTNLFPSYDEILKHQQYTLQLRDEYLEQNQISNNESISPQNNTSPSSPTPTQTVSPPSPPPPLSTLMSRYNPNHDSLLSLPLDHAQLPTEYSMNHTELTTQLRNTMFEACSQVFMSHPHKRLMEAIFKVEMQVAPEYLGRLIGVITRRRGVVLSDSDVTEGTNFFCIKATLPVSASFGFVTEVREKTSGQTNPVLVFSHWGIIQTDPYFVPRTEEEKDLLGLEAGFNFVKNIITDVRKRKGLITDQLVVAKPEKQRTLAKKK